MKNLVLLLIATSFLTGCFSSDDSDPTKGRQKPVAQADPPVGVTESGETKLCTEIVDEEYKKYMANLAEHKKYHKQTLDAEEAKYQNTVAEYDAKLLAKNNQCQAKVDQNLAEFNSVRATMNSEKNTLLNNINLHKQEVEKCIASKKVDNPQEFDGLLYHLDLNEEGSNPRSLDFTNGVAANHFFNTRLLVGNGQAIKSFDVETDAQGLQVKQNGGGAWVLSWKPNHKFEPGEYIKTYKLILNPNRKHFSAEQNNLLGDKDLSTKIMLIVKKAPATAPKVDIVGLPKTVTSASQSKIYVEVTEEQANSERPPFVNIQWPSSTMNAGEINGTQLIVPNIEEPPQFDGQKTWVFSYVLNTALVKAGEQEQFIRFQVAALSQVQGLVSEPQNKTVRMLPGGGQ